MRNFASSMDFFFSAIFFPPLFPVFNFAPLNIFLYTVPLPSFLVGVIIKYVTYFSFTFPSINITNPIQPI